MTAEQWKILLWRIFDNFILTTISLLIWGIIGMSFLVKFSNKHERTDKEVISACLKAGFAEKQCEFFRYGIEGKAP